MPIPSPEFIGGTVDGEGRLTAADPPLAQLQREAGSELGRPLAVPQLALIVRLAQKLGVTVSRPALAASSKADLDLWVRAEPEGADVRLTIESWIERPSLNPRWPASPQAPANEVGQDTFELDPELRVASISPNLAALLGTTPERAKGLPLTRLLQLEANSQGDMPLLGALGQRRPFTDQRAVLRRGGSVLTLAGDVRLGPDGSFAGFSGWVMKEGGGGTAKPEVSAELDELLRLPLDRIVTEAERIASRRDGPLRSDYAAYANDIMAASRHLLDVLRSMTEGARRTEPEEHTIDLAALALEAAGLVQAQAVEAGVSLELEGETTLPAHGDARAVTQILVNLIGNAVRYSPRGGSVRITAAREDVASITVSDEGPGVPDADRMRIFEPFEQAAASSSGAGLGLAISRRLARSMGGDIALDGSSAPGARFRLSLPVAGEAAGAE